MAIKNQSNWTFAARLAGVAGFLLAAAGLVLWIISVARAAEETGGAVFSTGLGIFFVVVGGLLAIGAILLELPAVTRTLKSRQGAFGSNVALQVVLATLLLIGVNAFSFFHYERFDWTRDQNFSEIREKFGDQLARLRGETSIVVFLRHTSFGQAASRQDNYDSAAERKIVAKIKDIVEQFREFGPRFRVQVLDIQEQGYEDQLKAIAKKTPALAEAIEKAPENSVFFYSHVGGDAGRVQRLSFHDIYQLDRVASRAAQEKRGNLVLTYQGVEPFARKVLNIEEKKPHIAVAVVHEYLGLKGPEMFGMPGAEKMLASRGFTMQDIVLKSKWGEGAMPEPSVLTHDEHRYEKLEDSLNAVNEVIKIRDEELGEIKKEQETWSKTKLDDLKKQYVFIVDFFGRGQPVERKVAEDLKKAGRPVRIFEINDKLRANYLQILESSLNVYEMQLKEEKQERQELLTEQKGLNVENLTEQRRISDLKAKFDRLLSKADLLILPRLTLLNAAQREYIPNELHLLDEAQEAAIKDFMKSGKPVLFCLGPSNEASERFNPLQMKGNRIEEMLEEIGVKLPKQTVLFNVETKSFAQRRPGILILGTHVDPPPVKFDWEPGPLAAKEELAPNPLRTSMKITTRSIAEDEPLALRLRNPRPVYFEAPDGEKPTAEAVFMVSDDAAWNESQPFAAEDQAPKYDPAKVDDDKRGTLEEERRGPFPLAVAVETKLPRSWYKPGEERKDERLAVIGHGGVFMGETLTPVKEKLLLDTVNWLLGRDELLAQDKNPWKYPRVELTPLQFDLWMWAAGCLLPATFFMIGCTVMMVRHTR